MIHEKSHMTGDGVVPCKGLMIWVLNDLLGEPPTKHIVGEVLGEKILYTEPYKGSIGCKTTVAYSAETRALERTAAIRREEEERQAAEEKAQLTSFMYQFTGVP